MEPQEDADASGPPRKVDSYWAEQIGAARRNTIGTASAESELTRPAGVSRAKLAWDHHSGDYLEATHPLAGVSQSSLRFAGRAREGWRLTPPFMPNARFRRRPALDRTHPGASRCCRPSP